MTATERDTHPALPPPAPLREWAVERLFRLFVSRLPIRVLLPGGERLGDGGPDSPVMRVIRPAHLFRRLAVVGPVGFGEAYQVGDWTCTDLAALLTPFAARLTRPASRLATGFRRWADQARPADERNTVEGAQTNVRRHYDLSNDLFALFLDESMTYSGALFGPGDDLHAAQVRKVEAILDRARVREGSSVLEIGTGWGELAIRAARRGAQVTTLTLSREQRDFVSRRIADEGVANQINLLLQDYRHTAGRYDAVISVEMIEAVGREYWPEYFATLNRLLAPGGTIALQAITMPHDRMLAIENVRTWIDKYVFPGGRIPSVRAIEDELGKLGMRITDRTSLGRHYARTLSAWRGRFTARRDEVAALGFGEDFQRLWEYYLAYSEAGFRAAFLDVWQFQVTR